MGLPYWGHSRSWGHGFELLPVLKTLSYSRPPCTTKVS